jgi:hypothetical protein
VNELSTPKRTHKKTVDFLRKQRLLAGDKVIHILSTTRNAEASIKTYNIVVHSVKEKDRSDGMFFKEG